MGFTWSDMTVWHIAAMIIDELLTNWCLASFLKIFKVDDLMVMQMG